jgi:hypothetical protein
MSGPRRPFYIQFDPLVSVIPIPSHKVYDHYTCARLYASNVEATNPIAQNTQEYSYKLWDWQNIIEEVGMYVHV